MKSYFYIFVIIIFLGIGCATPSPIDLPNVPFEPDISLQETDGQYVITISLTNNKFSKKEYEFIKKITDIKLFTFEKGNPKNSYSFEQITKYDIPNAPDSYIINLFDRLIIPKDKSAEQCMFVIKSNGNLYKYRCWFDKIDLALDRKTALVLFPFIRKDNDTTVTFGAKALRNIIIEDEYIPNSETFRVSIISPNGETAWISNYKMNFMQAINEALPKYQNNSHIYETSWNGKRFDGSPLPEGLYTIIMSVPAKPVEYTTSFKYYWKPSND